MKIRRSVAYGIAAAAALVWSLFSTDWHYGLMASCLTAMFAVGALFFYARERRTGEPKSVGFVVLMILELVFAVLAALPAFLPW